MSKRESQEYVLETTWQYNIPISTDLTAIYLKYGAFDYIVTGPALTADLFNIKTNPDNQGRIYLLFSNDTPKIIEWYNDPSSGFENVGDVFLPTLWKEKNGNYYVAVIDPVDYGMNDLHPNGLLLFSTDSVVRYLEQDLLRGIVSNDIYITRPKELNEEIKLINANHKMFKFSQLYIKAYRHLGMKVDFEIYKLVWRSICANLFMPERVNDLSAMMDWINELENEPITYMR